MKTFPLHNHIPVRGALAHCTERQLGRLFRDPDSGRRLRPFEARRVLIRLLAQGQEAIPAGGAR